VVISESDNKDATQLVAEIQKLDDSEFTGYPTTAVYSHNIVMQGGSNGKPWGHASSPPSEVCPQTKFCRIGQLGN